MKKIRRMMDLGLVPSAPVDFKSKCEDCVQAKQPRKPYKFVERKTQNLYIVMFVTLIDHLPEVEINTS